MKSQELTVVGMQHRVTPSTRRQIARVIDENGAILCSIEREPKNVHHANAIKVIVKEPPWKDLHVAYVPRSLADVFAPAIDEGKVLNAKLWLLWIDIDRGEAEAILEWKSPGKKKKSKK